MDIRRIIKAQMERRDMTAYKLTGLLSGQVPAATIYEFLRGDTAINSDHLGKILDACGLVIAAEKPKK
jgi:hypothetical protein